MGLHIDQKLSKTAVRITSGALKPHFKEKER